MNSFAFLCAIKSRGALGYMIITLFLLLLATIAITGLNNAYAVKFFTSGEKPFGVSYDDWISKYWNWDFSLNNIKCSIPKEMNAWSITRVQWLCY